MKAAFEMGYNKDISRYNKTSLYERVKKLLVSDEWSDCSFSVCGKSFKAHRLILGITSPVFKAMLYGPLSTNEEIQIVDIDPDTFQQVLNYVYTDTVEITSIEEAFELLYASRKYLLEHLSDLCIIFIQANISVDNVIEILNYPDYMQDKKLMSVALNLFCEHAKFLFVNSKHLINDSCMKSILECDKMNISEKDLIIHVFEWSTHYCMQNSIVAKFENRRHALQVNGLFKHLRFLTLSSQEIDEIFNDVNNLLMPNEADNLKTIVKSTCIYEHKQFIDTIEFVVIPRTVIKLQWYLCYRSGLRSVAPVVINYNHSYINCKIQTDKSVFINSLCVPTRTAPGFFYRNNSLRFYSEQLSVSIKNEQNNEIMFTNFMNTVEYDSVANIELTEPCFLQRGKWYELCFKWSCSMSHSYNYSIELRDHVYKGHKVTILFDDLPALGNSGSFLGGLKFCL